jgi:hypothetical protein
MKWSKQLRLNRIREYMQVWKRFVEHRKRVAVAWRAAMGLDRKRRLRKALLLWKGKWKTARELKRLAVAVDVRRGTLLLRRCFRHWMGSKRIQFLNQQMKEFYQQRIVKPKVLKAWISFILDRKSNSFKVRDFKDENSKKTLQQIAGAWFRYFKVIRDRKVKMKAVQDNRAKKEMRKVLQAWKEKYHEAVTNRKKGLLAEQFSNTISALRALHAWRSVILVTAHKTAAASLMLKKKVFGQLKWFLKKSAVVRKNAVEKDKAKKNKVLREHFQTWKKEWKKNIKLKGKLGEIVEKKRKKSVKWWMRTWKIFHAIKKAQKNRKRNALQQWRVGIKVQLLEKKMESNGLLRYWKLWKTNWEKRQVFLTF